MTNSHSGTTWLRISDSSSTITQIRNTGKYIIETSDDGVNPSTYVTSSNIVQSRIVEAGANRVFPSGIDLYIRGKNGANISFILGDANFTTQSNAPSSGSSGTGGAGKIILVGTRADLSSIASPEEGMIRQVQSTGEIARHKGSLGFKLDSPIRVKTAGTSWQTQELAGLLETGALISQTVSDKSHLPYVKSALTDDNLVVLSGTTTTNESTSPNVGDVTFATSGLTVRTGSDGSSSNQGRLLVDSAREGLKFKMANGRHYRLDFYHFINQYSYNPVLTFGNEANWNTWVGHAGNLYMDFDAQNSQRWSADARNWNNLDWLLRNTWSWLTIVVFDTGTGYTLRFFRDGVHKGSIAYTGTGDTLGIGNVHNTSSPTHQYFSNLLLTEITSDTGTGNLADHHIFKATQGTQDYWDDIIEVENRLYQFDDNYPNISDKFKQLV